MSRFYISLEDDLMRLFGGERITQMMDTLKVDEDTPIESEHADQDHRRRSEEGRGPQLWQSVKTSCSTTTS